jgi:RNA polymerase sigma factor (TIGR02999 family)
MEFFMPQPSSEEITQLLLAWGDGDKSALERLMPLVYEEMRKIARRYMNRQRPGHTLQTTALVNEAYLRLIDSNKVQWQNRAHFFAISAQLMRRILVDFARTRFNLKHGGHVPQVSLDEAMVVASQRSVDLIALDDALKTLASFDPRQSQIVELRYFGGLTEEEVGEVVKTSTRTVRREWAQARAWLFRELEKR